MTPASPRILTINSGSSSIKFARIDLPPKSVAAITIEFATISDGDHQE